MAKRKRKRLTEYDIHMMIENQNPEAKQRIWEKIQARLNGPIQIYQISITPCGPNLNDVEKRIREINLYLDVYSTKEYAKDEIVQLNDKPYRVCSCSPMPSI